MKFRLVPMNEGHARAIASWHYEGIYAFYDMDQDQDDMEELLDPSNWREIYRAVLNELNELVGFFSFEKENDGLSIGCGLRPDYTGKGLGKAFIETGLGYAKRRYAPEEFRLSVATFNRRAIAVYEKAGFERGEVFVNETNGGQFEFLRMSRKA